MKPFPLLIFAVKCIFFVSVLFSADTDLDRQLTEYKKKIVESKESLEALAKDIDLKTRRKLELEKKEEISSGKLDVIAARISKIESDITFTDRQFLNIQKKYSGTQHELSQVRKKEFELKELLKKELRFIYKRGAWNTSSWDFWTKEILLAGNAADFYKRYRIFKILLKQKSDIFQQALEVENRILLLRRRLGDQKKEKAVLLSRLEDRNADLISNRNRERNMLERIRKEKSAYESDIQKLKETEEEITKLIHLFTQKSLETEDAKKTVRKTIEIIPGLITPFAFPTSGNVATRFGKQKHPEFNTYRIVNGVEIKGNYGQDVRNVSAGTVIFCNVFKSYGKTVIVDHGGGYFTVYAYLKDIYVLENDRISGDKVIGTMGYSHLTKDPMLYFEVRKNGKPVNPQELMR